MTISNFSFNFPFDCERTDHYASLDKTIPETEKSDYQPLHTGNTNVVSSISAQLGSFSKHDGSLNDDVCRNKNCSCKTKRMNRLDSKWINQQRPRSRSVNNVTESI